MAIRVIVIVLGLIHRTHAQQRRGGIGAVSVSSTIDDVSMGYRPEQEESRPFIETIKKILFGWDDPTMLPTEDSSDVGFYLPKLRNLMPSPTIQPTNSKFFELEQPSTTPPALVGSQGALYCTCQSCTQEVWDGMALGISCGDRITYLQTNYSNIFPTQADACLRVGYVEFPLECGACDPSRCDDRTPPPPPDSYCGCDSCTNAVWTSDASDLSCGARISWVNLTDPTYDEAGACSLISTQFESICGPYCDPTVCFSTPTEPPLENNMTHHCGCLSCTDEVWNTISDIYTCGDRIEYILGSGSNESDACTVVSEQFPDICGPYCNPALCDQGQNEVLTPTTSLYCYPAYEDRVRWTGMWDGNYTVEVKEGSYCGPGPNTFSRETVAVNGSNLILEFKNINGSWTGSEVRVFLPEAQIPFAYGTYAFSVGSVQVINVDSGAVVSTNALPPSLVLGMFTWDATESYESHINWNHEVDIEISRWMVPSADDAQFLVQPPGSPQMHRFSTAGLSSNSQAVVLDQGNHVYAFTWNPGAVSWNTDAGVGTSFEYSTADTIAQAVPDLVQCLPASIEIRINLWNSIGIGAPMEMSDNEMAQVVIENFTYTPSGLTSVTNGGACTKNCQCSRDSQCQNNVCTLL